MRRSLRVRLQAWYGVVLCAVVAGFAGIMYQRERAALFSGVDADLAAAVQYLDVHLRRYPSFELVSGQPDAERPPRKGKKPPPRWFDDKGKRPPPPAKEAEQLLAELELPGRSGARTYFAVWREDHTLLKAADQPEDTIPPRRDLLRPQEPLLTQRGELREAMMPGPAGSLILVGHSLHQELAALRAFAWRLGGAGAVVLAVGLAGGWYVSGRILRPLASIAATASSISATNLTERIDPREVDAELAELARVLNATFDRLQAAFERQARFTADASHELRTPLTILRSHAELALARPRPPEEYRSALTACLHAADRMTTLVEGLLTMARADAGTLDQTAETVDLKELIEENLALLRPLAEAKGVELTAALATARIKADPLRLTQLVTNLLNNAVQHNRRGGKVHVCLGIDSGSISLTVSDTGPGISAEDRTRVFERFFRADKARTRASGGYGLGLPICKNIVEAHGGSIDFESLPGRGTTFWVKLPFSAPRS
jgi:two-component system OmpR family sensor kinase